VSRVVVTTRATLVFAPPTSHPTMPRVVPRALCGGSAVAGCGGHIEGVRVIGVIDLKAGLAVHARGGRRDAYEPVRSPLISQDRAGDAAALARAYRDQVGLAEIYVADLDAITGITSAPQDLRGVLAAGLPVMVDAGTTTVAGGRAVRDQGATRVVIGLETLTSFEDLTAIVREIGAAHVLFSLDLRDGHPVTRVGASFERDTPLALAQRAAVAGVEGVLVLDLGRVGRSSGPDLALVRSIRAELAHADLLVGGGVRGAADLDQLAGAGCTGALVGTALHTGLDLSRFR
jgi:phosphoribosylformimino-5-aminoimidazole carboxamide ribotide isomerase